MVVQAYIAKTITQAADLINFYSFGAMFTTFIST